MARPKRTEIFEKRFSIDKMVINKFDSLANHLEKISHSDVVWLSRIEDFYLQHEYLTPRQFGVLDSISKRVFSTVKQ